MYEEIPKTVLDFNNLFYYSGKFTWNNTYYRGLQCLKNPLDLWVMQEIIFEVQPDIIIETGTAYGGTTLFFADMMQNIHKDRMYQFVVTIDIKPNYIFNDDRIFQIISDSKDIINVIEQTKNIIKYDDKILIDLDSDHSKDHVLKELQLYNQFVSLGSYIIVEDTNVTGAYEAVLEFLKDRNDFMIDRSKEKYMCTFNPSGYLKRVKI